VTRCWVDTWTFKKKLKKFKKNQNNQNKQRSDTWHTPGLTRVHFKKILKNFKKN